jgi:hypothetical protein
MDAGTVVASLPVTMISWDTCKDDFRWDGSLRDIYIRPASLDDWRTIYPFLRSQSEIEYSTESGASVVPEVIEASFFENSRPTLRFRVGGILVVFHFFTPDEIECDIDPREVTCQSDLDSLLAFLRQLGELTRKRAVMTPENLPDEPIISYDPKTRTFRYHPSVA